jgi:hypothetical protein
MANKSVRFGVGSPQGPRSSEWLVVWKTKTSDVYLAARTHGGLMRASFHASGQCHVHTPTGGKWLGRGEPPKHLDRWFIDPSGEGAHVMTILVPASELRDGQWVPLKDKGTKWFMPSEGLDAAIAVFFLRGDQKALQDHMRATQHVVLVFELLTDGRWLIVVARDVRIVEQKHEELRVLKPLLRKALRGIDQTLKHPRAVLLAGYADNGPRQFIDAALD